MTAKGPHPLPKQEAFDQPNSLMQETIRLLKEKNLLEIYADTKVPFFWLRKFVAGQFKNPSVNRVQFLYEYLSGQKIIH